MTSAVIAGFVRTPFHFAKKGALVGVRPDDLCAIAVRELVQRTKIDPNSVDDLLVGCAYPEGEQGDNVARIVGLLAQLPISVSAMTVNRFCGSSMSGVHIAAGQICAGAGDVFICAGVESMSRVPQGGFSFTPNPRFRFRDKESEIPIEAYVTMGQTAENVAATFNISRRTQEEFAYRSQAKAAFAQRARRLAEEIVPVRAGDALVSEDGCLRPATSLEGLSALKPAFRSDGTVTAGTSSPLTDGASAVLVCSDSYARANGLTVLARIRSFATAGVQPELMGMGPVPATLKALARAGLKTEDIDLFEINEAFASQAVACIQQLGISEDKVNIDGGGIAIGHPLGATGARITGKVAQLMRREQKKFGVATQCIGGGQGVAIVLEAP